MPSLCHPCMLALFLMSRIFLISAVTSFLSCILNVRNSLRLYSFSLSLSNFPMRSHTVTSELSSGRNRTISTLISSRALFVLDYISCTATSCFTQDFFNFRSFYPINHTCSYPPISSLLSLSSASSRSALSAFSLQLCLPLALSTLNICASIYIAHTSLLLVSTLSAFTYKIPVGSSSLEPLCKTSSSSSNYFIIPACSNVVLSNF